MKGKAFKAVMSIVAVLFTIASLSMLFAWYTNVNKVGEIDAESNDVSITYTINNRVEKNEKSYSITNLTFFDLNNENELSYFNDMKETIKLTINNLDDNAKSVKIAFNTNKIIKAEGERKTSVAYPVGIINEATAVDINGKVNVLGLLPDTRVDTEASYTQEYTFELLGNSSKDIYIHMFGVQEVPSSDNSFLFGPDLTPVEYQFKLILEATNKKSNVVAKS